MNRVGLGLFFLCAVLLGCGPGQPSEEAAVGTWTGTFSAEGVEPFDYTLELHADKTFSLSNSLGTKEAGKWSYGNGEVTLDYGAEEVGQLSPGRARTSTLIMRNDREMDHKTSTGKGTPDFAKKL